MYFNCAAGAPTHPAEVIDAVVDVLQQGGAVARGGHSLDLEAARRVYMTRSAVAEWFDFPYEDRVCFFSSATSALNTVLYGMVEWLQSEGHSSDSGSCHPIRVCATEWDHNAVLRPLYRLEDKGMITLSVVPARDHGRFFVEDFEELLRSGTDLLVLTHGSNVTGALLDLQQIVALAHTYGARVVLDASQSIPYQQLLWSQIPVDVLCCATHKGLLAPAGAAVTLIAPDTTIVPTVVGGSGVMSQSRYMPEVYPEHLEAGTLNLASVWGLHAALRWHQSAQGQEAMQRMEEASQEMYRKLKDLTGYVWHAFGESSEARLPLISCQPQGYTAHQLADLLAENFDIACRYGLHCAPLIHKRLGTEVEGAVRFSWNCLTSQDEYNGLYEALATLGKRV